MNCCGERWNWKDPRVQNKLLQTADIGYRHLVSRIACALFNAFITATLIKICCQSWNRIHCHAPVFSETTTISRGTFWCVNECMLSISTVSSSDMYARRPLDSNLLKTFRQHQKHWNDKYFKMRSHLSVRRNWFRMQHTPLPSISMQAAFESCIA